ncbi:MAG: helix-turn-helix domain-containing protein [Ilumatobacteraceae bacterium]
MIPASLQRATEVAGDRWVLLVLAALSDGSRRFGDIVNDLTDGRGSIAPNVLTDRLRRMERDGLIDATLYTDRPRRYVYALTESGRELSALVPALTAWAARRAGGEPLLHDLCGSPLETRVWCPTCQRTVDRSEHVETDSDHALRWV